MGRGRRTALSAGKAQLSSTLRASSSSAWLGIMIYKVFFFHFNSNLSPVVLNTPGLEWFSYRIVDFDFHLSPARAFSSAQNEMLKLMIFTLFFFFFKFQFSSPLQASASTRLWVIISSSCWFWFSCLFHLFCTIQPNSSFFQCSA